MKRASVIVTLWGLDSSWSALEERERTEAGSVNCLLSFKVNFYTCSSQLGPSFFIDFHGLARHRLLYVWKGKGMSELQAEVRTFPPYSIRSHIHPKCSTQTYRQIET